MTHRHKVEKLDALTAARWEIDFRRVFQDNFRPEVASDVISGADVKQVGPDVPVKLGDSRSSRSRDV